MINSVIRVAAFAMITAMGAQGYAAGPSQSARIATGGEAGVYYPIGKAICGALETKRDSHNISCTVQVTSGSVENVKILDQKGAEFAIIQSDIQMQALNGVKTFRDMSPQIYMRSLFSLHAEPLHLMIAKNSDVTGFDKLKGKAVSFGPVGSGSHALVELILKERDWDKSKFSAVYDLSSSDQVNALCQGKIHAGFWVAGLNNEVMRDAAKQCGIGLAPLKGGWVDSFILDNPQFASVTIPKNTYKTTKSAIRTFGPKATLMVNADVPEEIVYQLVKSVFENFDQFRKMHPALSRLNREEMLDDGVIAPFHPGARKYYKEKGWIRF